MTVLLAMPGAESPAETDFEAENALIVPRSLDLLNLYQSIDSEPLWYGAYATWATALNAKMFISWSSATHTMGAATGGTFNAAIDAAAAQLTGIAPTTVYIRPFYEMNGNWNSYGYTQETAASFVSGWQYLVNRLRVTDSVTNAKFIWSPNIWGGIESATVDPTTAAGIYPCYPGDSYVDYIALDGYMMTSDSVARTPQTIFLSNYAELIAMTSKPFGFGEVGCAADSRLAALCGGKAGWFSLLFQMITNSMPNCAFMDYYNRYISGEGDFTINSSTAGLDTAALAAFVGGVNWPPFAADHRGLFHL